VFRCRARDISSLKSGDDAKSLKVKPLREVLKLKNLAFDHKHIFEEYAKKFHPQLLE
jgi:succinate dehydrogenase/fumarate reductase-like Fe-S protein